MNNMASKYNTSKQNRKYSFARANKTLISRNRYKKQELVLIDITFAN